MRRVAKPPPQGDNEVPAKKLYRVRSAYFTLALPPGSVSISRPICRLFAECTNTCAGLFHGARWSFDGQSPQRRREHCPQSARRDSARKPGRPRTGRPPKRSLVSQQGAVAAALALSENRKGPAGSRALPVLEFRAAYFAATLLSSCATWAVPGPCFITPLSLRMLAHSAIVAVFSAGSRLFLSISSR